MKYNSTTATTDKKKADVFADYSENEVYSKTPDTLPFHDQVTSQTFNLKRGMFQAPKTKKWRQITEKEVKGHIKELRNSSTGPDFVHNRCLQNKTIPNYLLSI